MEHFSKQTWKSRKLWTCLAILAVGVATTILAPAAAGTAFYSFLLAVAALYIGGNLGEYALKGPLVHAKSEDEDTE